VTTSIVCFKVGRGFFIWWSFSFTGNWNECSFLLHHAHRLGYLTEWIRWTKSTIILVCRLQQTFLSYFEYRKIGIRTLFTVPNDQNNKNCEKRFLLNKNKKHFYYFKYTCSYLKFRIKIKMEFIKLCAIDTNIMVIEFVICS